MSTHTSLRSWKPAALALLLALASIAVGADAEQAATGAQRAFLWKPFLAPFHAVVLHFPIGFLSMACLLEMYRMRRPTPEVRFLVQLTLWLSLITGLISAVFGILRATGGGYSPHELEVHRWTGIGVVAATVATLIVQRRAVREGSRWVSAVLYRVLLASTLALVVIAGHVGGGLTHGANYLTENAPTFVRELIEEAPMSATAVASSPGGSESERLFIEKVQPVFEKKCANCHGATKQKGDYRLDRADVAIAGGESGKAAIKPGEPMASELLRLILLPPDDDDVMPPDGKEPVTAEEALAIIRWIQKGAPFPGVASTTADKSGQ